MTRTLEAIGRAPTKDNTFGQSWHCRVGACLGLWGLGFRTSSIMQDAENKALNTPTHSKLLDRKPRISGWGPSNFKRPNMP